MSSLLIINFWNASLYFIVTSKSQVNNYLCSKTDEEKIKCQTSTLNNNREFEWLWLNKQTTTITTMRTSLNKRYKVPITPKNVFPIVKTLYATWKRLQFVLHLVETWFFYEFLKWASFVAWLNKGENVTSDVIPRFYPHHLGYWGWCFQRVVFCWKKFIQLQILVSHFIDNVVRPL